MNVGLNLRLLTTFEDLIVQAERLELLAVQSFVTVHETGRYISMSQERYKNFTQYKKNIELYVHGSYKINLASMLYAQNSCYFLKKELEIAKKLGSGYLVVHPGAVEVGKTHEQGIDAVAKKINTVFKKGYYPTLLIENVAFGNRCIGGDINDLSQLRAKIDKPETIKFCIDTAHAYSYGYNIADLQEQDRFIAQLDKLLGIDSIALLHLNDTQEKFGSQQDRHAVPGHGLIGVEALKKFVSDPRLKHIPCIVELPNLDEKELKKIVLNVSNWRNG